MHIAFTGNGKGKTTAAIGNAIRIIGADKRALMV
jgi:ATP:corrinoid adenosyltransferase